MVQDSSCTISFLQQFINRSATGTASSICFLCGVKVLILHQHFNTPDKGGPLRSYYLAKALVDRGISVSVVTTSKESGYSNVDVEGIDVHFLPIPYDNRFGFYKRGFSFIRYAIDSVRIASKLKDVSVCYAISVPLTTGLSAIWLKRLRKIPFVFEVGDLWPDAPIQLGYINNALLQRWLYLLEKRIYRSASAVVALSHPIADAIKRKAQQTQVEVITNFADTDAFKPNFLQQKDSFVVSYIGAVGFANGLDFFLECARAAQKASLPIKFMLCGDGAAFDSLKSTAERLVLQNLIFVPFTNRAGVQQVLDATDASFICYRPFRILETGSPNKYFDGLAAGKLIITNFGGWIADEIAEEKCGVTIDSKFPHDFVTKIEPFIHSRDLLKAYQQNSRSLAERKYSRSLLGAQFADLMKKYLR